MPEDQPDTWDALLMVHAALVPRLDRELQDTHGLPLSSTPRRNGVSPRASSAQSSQ